MSPSSFDRVPDAREVFETLALSKFGRLVYERQLIRDEIKEAEAKVKSLDTEIMEMMTENDAPKVMHGDTLVSLVEGKRNNLDKEKLIEKGVPASLIKDCTTTTTYTYVLVK